MLYFPSMVSVSHTLVAISIAAKISNPAIALPLSFFSNYVLDMIPHWDFGYGWREKTKRKLFLEGFADVAVRYLLVLVILGVVRLWQLISKNKKK